MNLSKVPHVFLRLLLLCLLILGHKVYANTGLPVWPITHNDNNCQALSWYPSVGVSQVPYVSSISTISGVALNDCGEPLFYVLHTGEDTENQLFCLLPDGALLHTEGINALHSADELQVLKVPETDNEWYLIYSRWTDVVVSSGNPAYTPATLAYSRVFYDGINFSFTEKDVALQADGQLRTYTHGKAVSISAEGNVDEHYLYATRRAAGEDFISLDRFLIDDNGISWSANTGNVNAPAWVLTFAGSPVELSHQEDKIAVVNRNQSYDYPDIFIFDAVAFNNVNVETISIGQLVLQPDFATITTAASLQNLVASALAFGYFRNVERKVSGIEFSPDGDYLYFTGGGYAGGSLSNITYLGQIDLTGSYPYDLRLQAQAPPYGTFSTNDGAGCNFGVDPNCLENYNSITNIEAAYDGNLYFQKRNSGTLFVIPEPNLPMPQQLAPGWVDLSTALEPNVDMGFANTEGYGRLPDPIDGFQYVDTIYARFQIPVSVDGCLACLASTAEPKLVELQTETGTVVESAMTTACPYVFDICLRRDETYRLMYNGDFINDVVVNGVISSGASFVFEDFSDMPPHPQLADKDTLLCGSDTVLLKLSYLTPLPNYTYEWSPAGELNDPNALDAIALVTAETTYTLTVTDDNGCTATYAYDIFKNLDITPNILPISAACLGDALLLQMDEPPLPNINYQWEVLQGTETVTFEGAGPHELTRSIAGLHEVRLRASDPATGCEETVSDDFQTSGIGLQMPESQAIEVGEELSLEPVLYNPQNADVNYIWEASSGVVPCPDCEQLTVSPNAITTYEVLATDEHGCTASGYVTVEVHYDDAVLLPNAFSPNNDGVNDSFGVNAPHASLVNLQIFNRWGETIWEGESWDGYQTNGKAAELGVYVYIVTLLLPDGSAAVYKGNVTLVR